MSMIHKPCVILVAGIGGVGGYYGGMLAKHYQDSEKVHIRFLARGNHAVLIQNEGLLVQTSEERFRTHPERCSSDANALGIADYILICCKQYDLPSMLQAIKPAVGTHTVLISLLNGMGHAREIQTRFPLNRVWEGCVYLVSRKVRDGHIEKTGAIHSLYFGNASASITTEAAFLQCLTQAGIEAYWSKEIRKTIWEKFIFLSPIACCTTAFDKSIGELLQNASYKKHIEGLIAELLTLAQQKHIGIPLQYHSEVMQKYHQLPEHTTSSMHADFARNPSRTEWNALCEYVMEEAELHQIKLEFYPIIDAALKQRISIESGTSN